MSNSKFNSFITGVIAGTIIGLLTAPEKGGHTRGRLTYLAERYRVRISEIISDLKTGKDKMENQAKVEGNKMIKAAKEKAKNLLDDVNLLINKKK